MTERELEQLDAASRRLYEMYQRGQYTLLLHEVDELAKAGPSPAGVYGVAAMALTALDRFEEAVIAAGVALQQEPNWAWLYHAFAAAKAGQKATQEAITAQTRAAVLAPEAPIYGAALAQYLRASGQAEHAAHAARRALKADPRHGGALGELSLALLELGDAAGAMEQIKQAQVANPSDPEGYITEGLIHARGGARTEARRAYREALRRAPGLAAAEDRMAETLGARALVANMLLLGRITLVGWSIVAFLYYVTFRLLEMLWKAFPAFLPVGRTLLIISLVYLLGGLVVGRLLRWLFRTSWPA